jgi:hypothetical protein
MACIDQMYINIYIYILLYVGFAIAAAANKSATLGRTRSRGGEMSSGSKRGKVRRAGDLVATGRRGEG